MQIKDLLTDDDAVSPVIGVILMVAITVILAAVIAAFVLGLGDTNSVAPNTSFDISYNETTNGAIDIRVSSGDTVNSDRLSFTGDISSASSLEGASWTDTLSGGTTDLQAGSSTTIGASQSPVNAEDIAPDFLLEVTFTSESGDTSSVIASREGPER